jgi:lysophospholipase L1-like esterase
MNSSRLHGRGATTLAVIAAVALIAGLVIEAGGIFGGANRPPAASASREAAASTTPSPDATAAQTTSATTGSTASDAPSPSPQLTDRPTPRTAAVPLPALLAAIGDSYSQAWSVSSSYLYDHPQFSWVVGTSKNDGVLSLLERFRALGASPIVVDAATSGRKMADAQRQANLVVAAARKLSAGKIAYVTFELGTNDLCASPDFMTGPAAFRTQLQTAIATLKAGLPAGSRILMLPVPNFPHFRDITQASPAARALLALPRNLNRCAPYLGTYSSTAALKASSYLAQYDAGLKAACDDINAPEGTGGRLVCSYNAALLADSDFTIKDLSTVDYFHPSLSGQAKMAADAWRADVWASSTLP